MARLGLWFWGIQLARGVLMTPAVLPIILTLRLKRSHAAIAVGFLIWMIGGSLCSWFRMNRWEARSA